MQGTCPQHHCSLKAYPCAVACTSERKMRHAHHGKRWTLAQESHTCIMSTFPFDHCSFLGLSLTTTACMLVHTATSMAVLLCCWYLGTQLIPCVQNRIQGFGSTNASDPVASSSYSKGPSSSSGGFSSATSNGTGGGMVGFGNPRFSKSSKPSSSNVNPSKWLPTNLANKLDSLNVLPKDRQGGLRHSEVGFALTVLGGNLSSCLAAFSYIFSLGQLWCT